MVNGIAAPFKIHMSHDTGKISLRDICGLRKPRSACPDVSSGHMRTAKAQIRLRIRAV